MPNHKHNSGEHPDHPPVEGGYTGLHCPGPYGDDACQRGMHCPVHKDVYQRMVPRYNEPEKKLSPSQIGGLGHVHGMFCDGQDHGRADCDVQQAYYAQQHEENKKPAHLFYGHQQLQERATLTGAVKPKPFRDAFENAWQNEGICCLQPGVISTEEIEMKNPDAVPIAFSGGKGTTYVRKHTPHNLTPKGLARHQLVHLETLFNGISAGISGKLALKLVEAYREVCHLHNQRCLEVLALENQLRECARAAQPIDNNTPGTAGKL